MTSCRYVCCKDMMFCGCELCARCECFGTKPVCFKCDLNRDDSPTSCILCKKIICPKCNKCRCDIIKIPDDSKCLFHCFAHALKTSEDKVRLRIAAEIRENKEEYAPFLMGRRRHKTIPPQRYAAKLDSNHPNFGGEV